MDCPGELLTMRAPRQSGRVRHKVVITGTGRAGTTFLVRLLSALGLDTGYDDENWRADYVEHCSAGLEKDISDPDSPYVVKDPDLCVSLGALLAQRKVVVDHAIVPVRDLASAALSRMRIGGADHMLPGGLLGTSEPTHQEAVLARRFHLLVQTLVEHDVPCTFLHFPRLVHDPEYTFAKLKRAFPQLEHDRFMVAFATTAEPDLVHDFAGKPLQRSTDAIQFEHRQRTRTQRRRIRQAAIWITIVLALVTTVAGSWVRS